jgi:uncharacterized cupredoxin-like copper-binding protein
MTKNTPLTLLAIAGAAAVAGCGGGSSASSHNAAAKRTVPVTLSDFKVTPATAAAKPGRVVFLVKNASKTPHELVVLRNPKPAADLMNGHAAKATEAGHVGELSKIEPGQEERLALNLTPGHYDLICNYPGHYMGGMHANLSVS